MIVNSENNEQLTKANDYYKKLVEQKAKFELKKFNESRSSKQNRALHLYFSFICNELNELGMEFKYHGLNNNELRSRYTSNIVKNHIWRPIQTAMFNVESTKAIDTKQINEIIDVITKYFSDRGVSLYFPSIETLIDK